MNEKFDEIRRLAESGRTACQIELGNGYLTGATVGGRKLSQDYDEARRWLEAAHEQGAFTATFILGTMYEEGKGVGVDISKAIQHYENAAGRGAFLPCVRLARLYASGKGVTPSRHRAAEWYMRVLSFEGQIDEGDEMDEARAYLQGQKGP